MLLFYSTIRVCFYFSFILPNALNSSFSIRQNRYLNLFIYQVVSIKWKQSEAYPKDVKSWRKWKDPFNGEAEKAEEIHLRVETFLFRLLNE